MFLVRYEDHQWSPWSKDLKDFKQNRNKIQKNQERPLLTVLNYYSSNYSELSQNSESLSMENQNFTCKTLRFKDFKWPKSMFYERNYFIFLLI